METKQEYVIRIYNEARAKGLCFNQKDFADLLGMNQSTISNAINGKEKYLTESIIKRIQSWERQILRVDIPAPAPETRPDIVIPAATMDLYTSMAKSIDRLTALVERLQPGLSTFATAGVQEHTPKNYRLDK